MHKMKQNKGFTLVELSIVIVIIGLIVAGVVGGQSLVRQAKLRGVMTDQNSIEVAFNTFKLEYDAVPGDMNNAWNYWGAACGGNVQAHCNGNGNGAIDLFGNREDDIVWQHLSLAKLDPGNFTYVPNDTVLGLNIKTSPINNAGYWIWQGFATANADFLISLGTDRTDGSPYFNSGALTPTESFAIDSKKDDGRPGQGRIRTFKDQDRWALATICIDESYASPNLENSNYILTDKTTSCNLRHIMK